MIRYIAALIASGVAIILAEVVKWKAAEQFNVVFKTLMLYFKAGK